MRGLTKLEFICIVVFVFVGAFCLAGYFFSAYLVIPSIDLRGEKEITIDVGTKYSDPGVVAYIYDKDVTNRVVKNGTVDVDKIGKYKVTYSITNDRGFRKRKVKRTINVVDMEKPVITLEGKKKVVVAYGDSYQEAGYVAKDAYDGDITNKVVINGRINTDKLGTYILTYSVVDSSSNKVSVKRTIDVIDNKAPVIDLDGKSMMVIRLNGNFKDPGYTADDNYDGDVTGKVKVTGKVNTKKMGVYKITYTVRDSFGNVAKKVRKVQVGTRKDRDKLTYIEVSIAKQKLWFYKNGKLIVSSGIVSGQKGYHDTYIGKFRIYSMVRNTYLIGDDYRTWVDFWMPFSGDQGLHDATWRSSFGGNIYTYSGSHGCVNLPYGVAKKIFQEASVGTLVVVY